MTESGQIPDGDASAPAKVSSTELPAANDPQGGAVAGAVATGANAAVVPEARRSSKTMQPVIGYNHNARHNGRLFHLQTEDSGTKYARIITQLFMDGGRIVKSVKTSYADHLGDPNLADIVREMMRQQHKAMLIALRDGTFDSTIGTPSAVTTAAAQSVADPSDADATQRRAIDPDEDPPTLRQLPEELSLDLDALDRAVQASSSTNQGSFRAPSELPPPPANLLATKPGVGLFRAPREEEGPATSDAVRGNEKRYAPARPASIFGPTGLALGRTPSAPPLHDDQSLDEMILRYLADHDG